MLNRKKILLLVEDNPKDIELVRDVFENENYSLHIATNGNEAISEIEKLKPQLIILDIIMPQMNGYQVCQKIKLNPLYKEIPIIMLTAKTTEEDQAWGFELGADEYIKKPFHPQELLNVVKKCLEVKKAA